eukprot:3934723-Rhodomonas_salina.2
MQNASRLPFDFRGRKLGLRPGRAAQKSQKDRRSPLSSPHYPPAPPCRARAGGIRADKSCDVDYCAPEIAVQKRRGASRT